MDFRTVHLIRLTVVFALTATVVSSQIQPQLLKQKRSFALDSTKSTYPFVMRLEGTMEINSDKILVSITAGMVGSAIPTDLGNDGKATNVQIAFGIGKLVPEGWTMEADTPSQEIAAELKPGEKRNFGQLTFEIPAIEGRPLAEQWLSARLTVTQALPGLPAGLLSSYACSEENLLGPTPASRARWQAMKQNYSQVC